MKNSSNQVEMKRSYLIQRLQKPMQFRFTGSDKKTSNPFAFGGGLQNGGLSDKAMSLIQEIWSFDYMGSSEFEWGAVPATLMFLAEQASNDNLAHGCIMIGHKDGTHDDIWVLAPKQFLEEACERIRAFRKQEPYGKTKEAIGLQRFFDHAPDDKWAAETCGWLELDNGYMFFTDSQMYHLTCKLFGVKQ